MTMDEFKKMIQTETLEKCPACLGINWNVHCTGRDYEFETSQDMWTSMVCTDCGNFFLNPRPTFSEAEKIYPSNYYPALTENSPIQNLINKLRYVLEKRKYLKLLQKLSPNAQIVDLGAGDGRVLITLALMSKNQFNFTAIDISIEPATKALLKRSSINFTESSLENFNFDGLGHKIDLVIMTQVIEHLWEPDKVLTKLSHVLSANGTILIETPNPDSVCRLIQGGRYWGGWHRPRHLNLFTYTAMEKMVERCGLSIEESTQFAVPAFWIMGFRNRLGLATNHRSGLVSKLISMRSLPALSLFTVIELFCGLFGNRMSNHRFILRKKI